MNRIERRSSGHSTLVTTLLTVLLLILLGGVRGAQAQWAQPTPAATGNTYTTTSGNVGIGTSSPQTTLHIQRDTNAEAGLYLLNNGGAANSRSIFLLGEAASNAKYGYLAYFGANYDTANLRNSTLLSNAGAGGLQLFSYGGLSEVGGLITFNTAPASAQGGNAAVAERMRIDKNGNVGVGTSSPIFDGNPTKYLTLDGGGNVFGSFGVGGNISSTTGVVGQMAFVNSNLTGTEKRVATIVAQSDGATNSGSLNFYTATAGSFASGPRMTILSSGNVGVGTTSPANKLDIASTGGTTTVGVKADANQIAQIGFFHGGTDLWYLSSRGAANAPTNRFSIFSNAGGYAERLTILNNGNVGIGNTNPAHTLEVSGTINASGAITGNTIQATYQDVAEWVPATDALAAGTVVILNPTKTNEVMASTAAYDTRVAGVVSARPGIALGEAGTGKVLVATTGRVRVKVDATKAPIHVGDLLVTSDEEGIAMKSEPVDLGGVKIHRPGTLIGKALESLERGTSEILVLLSLQ